MWVVGSVREGKSGDEIRLDEVERYRFRFIFRVGGIGGIVICGRIMFFLWWWWGVSKRLRFRSELWSVMRSWRVCRLKCEVWVWKWFVLFVRWILCIWFVFIFFVLGVFLFRSVVFGFWLGRDGVVLVDCVVVVFVLGYFWKLFVFLIDVMFYWI